jgi:ABC-type transport system involved in multi-copper enzyme maturation permease subunit
MVRMLGIEIRRCFARRLVRWLIVLAVVACVITALVAHRSAAGASMSEPFRLADLHEPERGDSFIGVAAFSLLIGAVVGGASMVGAEWRAGTLVTLLTWQPDRRRVAIAKLLACGIVATAIAVVLQVLFTAAFLPAALGPGTTEGLDAAWWRSVVGTELRVAGVIGLAALFVASVAMVGRNTAAALGVAFAYLMVVESIVHAWKPWASRFLLGPNGAIFVTGGDLDTEGFTRSTTTAGLTLLAYAGIAAVLAVVTFRRRDLASTA